MSVNSLQEATASVRKVVLYALDLLVIFVSLTGYENYVALLCQHAGCADGFLAVYDTDYLLHLLGIESGKHVVDDVLWLFETWAGSTSSSEDSIMRATYGAAAMTSGTIVAVEP